MAAKRPTTAREALLLAEQWGFRIVIDDVDGTVDVYADAVTGLIAHRTYMESSANDLEAAILEAVTEVAEPLFN